LSSHPKEGEIPDIDPTLRQIRAGGIKGVKYRGLTNGYREREIVTMGEICQKSGGGILGGQGLRGEKCISPVTRRIIERGSSLIAGEGVGNLPQKLEVKGSPTAESRREGGILRVLSRGERKSIILNLNMGRKTIPKNT